MTDTSKYTGSHKERFDESGKGKGLAGRDSVKKGKVVLILIMCTWCVLQSIHCAYPESD